MRTALALTLWRSLPRAWRHRFWTAVQAARRAILPIRIGRVWRRGHAYAGDGVVVAGLLRDTRGVAQAARLFALGLEHGGARVRRSDAGAALGLRPVLPPLPEASPDAPASLIVSCLNPPELLRWLDATGGRELRGRRHVGYWAWELPEAPPGWGAALRFVDEVWCHSDFAADAIRRLAGGAVPVRTLPLPMFAADGPGGDRARFGLPEKACVVLAAMDLRSSVARKNPLGALEAYQRAHPEPDDHAVLVCKISGLEAQTQAARALREAAEGRADIRLFCDLLSEADMHALTASADIILSLHRAEGFGLMAAEAAWLGKAVVATGWSAPVEFLHADGAALVDWKLAPVEDPQGQYGGPGALWAEPDLDDAAARLRALIQDPAARARMGAQARRHADQVFGAPAWTMRARALLDSA